MRHLVAIILGCILVAHAQASSLEALKTQMAISGSHLGGANFQLMLLLPTELAQTLSDLHISQMEITEATHVVDAVSAFTEEYKRQGGKIRNLDVAVKHPEALGFVRERGLAFYTKSMTDLPLRFSRKNKDVVVLPYRSIQSCLEAAQVGVTFEQKDKETFIVKTIKKEYTVERVAFEKTLLPYFTEACSFIELARHQAPTQEKTGLVFEFASLNALASSQLASETSTLVRTLISKFEEEAQKFYGEIGIATHVVFLQHAATVKAHSARILAEAAVTADVNDDYMHTIKYVFSIVFTILLAIICINMYTMEIYKDSLIYAKFLVKKNN